MNTSQMKNIIVIKDIPSNIIDEAIVILKSNVKVKNKEKIENKSVNGNEKQLIGSQELAVREAEIIIQNYIKENEKPTKKYIQNINIKYKKLQILSIFMTLTLIMGIIISIIK